MSVSVVIAEPGQPAHVPERCRCTLSAEASTTKSSPPSARTSGAISSPHTSIIFWRSPLRLSLTGPTIPQRSTLGGWRCPPLREPPRPPFSYLPGRRRKSGPGSARNKAVFDPGSRETGYKSEKALGYLRVWPRRGQRSESFFPRRSIRSPRCVFAFAISSTISNFP